MTPSSGVVTTLSTKGSRLAIVEQRRLTGLACESVVAVM